MEQVVAARPDNVLGEPIASCSRSHYWFFRDGWRNTGPSDLDHTVCAVMTEDFLAYSKFAGNTASVPAPNWVSG